MLYLRSINKCRIYLKKRENRKQKLLYKRNILKNIVFVNRFLKMKGGL